MNKTMSSASALDKVTSLVLDAQEARNIRAFCEAFAFNWDYFKLNLEFYHVPIHWGVQEKVLRLYREKGQLGHDAVAVFRHVEPKILNHSGFIPFDQERIKQWANELVKPVDEIKTCLEVLADNEFFDLALFQQGFLTSVNVQKSALRLGYKVPNLIVRIPLEILLVPLRERIIFCTTFDEYDHRLVRPYTKNKYAKICDSYEDGETMQLLIEEKAGRLKMHN